MKDKWMQFQSLVFKDSQLLTFVFITIKKTKLNKRALLQNFCDI